MELTTAKYTKSKHKKTNRILMAASLLLMLAPFMQAGQIRWGLQDVSIYPISGSTVTGSFVWDTAINGVASAHIQVNYYGQTLDINTADGATLNYFGVNATTGVVNNWQLNATQAEYLASGVFNGFYRIHFKEQNSPFGFADATTPQINVGFLEFRGNGCCNYSSGGSFVNLDLVESPEPQTLALAGPVIGLCFFLRRRRKA